MYKKTFTRCLIFLLTVGLVVSPGGVVPQPAFAQVVDIVDSRQNSEMVIVKNDLVTLKVYSLTRLSISNPSVADIVKADADELLIIGKNPGQTAFFLWDEYGKRTVVVRVIGADLLFTKTRIEKLMEVAGITDIKLSVNASEGKIMATGTAPKSQKNAFKNIINRFPDVVLDLSKAAVIEDLVQINVQISELSTTLQQALGFDWTTGDNSNLQFGFLETMPATEQNAFERLLKIGEFNRTSAILATVDLLLAEGKARVLSKPRLVVISGKEASFQVGGQIPVRSTTSNASGTTQESIDFKDYGIIMNITPTIREGGKITLTLDVQISDIDAANKVENDVAFTTRSAQTQLLLDDGQTIVLAGLIKQQKSVNYSKVPFLGDIPLLGMFFRKKETPSADTDTEVVISVTPTILKGEEEEEARSTELAQEDMDEIEKKIDQILESSSDDQAMEDTSEPEEFDDEEYLSEGRVTTEQDDMMAKDEDMNMMDKETMPQEEDLSFMEEESQGADQMMAEEKEEDSLRLKEKQGAVIEEARMENEPMIDKDEDSLRLKEKQGVVIEEARMENEPMIDKDEGTMDVSAIMSRYIQTIQQKIKQAISYPYEAIEKGWQGTVKLTLKILKDGTLDEILVKESSGYDIFDRDALNTAQILAPFEAFPPELKLQEIIITIPIVYNQDAASLDLAKLCSFESAPQRTTRPKPFLAGGKPYSQIVREKISQTLVYPKKAEEKGWEGTAKINLRILKDGTLAYAAIEESSGHTIFDQCAVETARRAAPYSVFPTNSDLEELDITVPINYSLERK